MLDIGRICVKLAGRDAGQIAVVVDLLDNHHALIDGQVRRRKCNILHLEPTAKKADVSKGAAHAKVVSALKDLGIEVVERKTKTQKSKKPVQVRKGKPAKVEAPKAKAAPKAEVKAAPKTEAKAPAKKPAAK